MTSAVRAVSFLVPARRLIVFVVGAVACAILLPVIFSGLNLLIVNQACIYGIAALGLNVIFGMTSLLSIAQAALMGVGAYTFVLTANRGIGFPATVVLACLGAAIVSAITGLISTRVRSHYFILITLALAETVTLVAANDLSLTGGDNGVALNTIPTIFGDSLVTPAAFAPLAIASLFLVWYLAECLRTSRFGVALRAISTDEYLAAVSGVAISRYRLAATVVGGAFAGLAGAMLAISDAFIGPQNFQLDTGILLLLMVVLAGGGSNTGTVIASAILTYLSQGLLTLAAVGELIYGVAIVVLLIAVPDGLAGVGHLIERQVRTGIRLLTVRVQNH